MRLTKQQAVMQHFALRRQGCSASTLVKPKTGDVKKPVKKPGLEKKIA